MTKKEIKELALDYAKSKSNNETYQKYLSEAFIEGFNVADSTKYSLEELNKALSYGYHTAKDEIKGIPSAGYGTRFLESLKQD